MTNKEIAAKIAAETGMSEEEAQKIVGRIAVCKRIDEIVFRAEAALYTEISLAYDEAALCETSDERKPHLERVAQAESSLRTLKNVADQARGEILSGERPAELPRFFKDILDVCAADDDEEIAKYLCDLGEETVEKFHAILREYVDEEFKEDGDEQ